MFTVISRNLAFDSMRAMALHAIEHLAWRHHGIGVLQAYLAEGSGVEVRMHVWCRRLLKEGIDISGDAHDHRFNMVSHVLCGTIAHEQLLPYKDVKGTHKMMALTNARAAAENNFHGPTTELPGLYSVHRSMHYIKAGLSYQFPAKQFHRSPLDGDIDDVAVTIVEKHNQNSEPARILYPVDDPPVMAFGHELDIELIERVLGLAREALKKAEYKP